jgi:type 1 glutamine amidotransferase
MPRRRARRWWVAVAVVLTLAATEVRSAPPRLLVLTYSAGYQHDVVKRPAAGGSSTVERVIGDLARRSGRFEITALATAEDLRQLTPSAVRAHRAMLFFTTGELPLRPEIRGAMFQSVRDGGGFVGVHSASDTWYAVPEYGELLGAYFDGHPWHQRVRVVVEDRTHPSTRDLGEVLEINDEIYQFRAWSRPAVHVLLRLDTRSVDAGRGRRSDGDYALAWTKRYGRGRVFYTALGHEPAVWEDARFQAHLLGAIQWALDGR